MYYVRTYDLKRHTSIYAEIRVIKILISKCYYDLLITVELRTSRTCSFGNLFIR